MTEESARACVARLHEMDRALERMERELPDDVRSFGAEAREHVAVWVARLSSGSVEQAEFTEAMSEISAMMDALTARLLLAPWDGPARQPLKS